MTLSERQKGILAILGLALNYVLIGILIRIFSNHLSLLQQVYLRVGAAFFLCLLLFKNQIRWPVILNLPAHEWLIITLRSIFFFAIGITLFSQAVIIAKFSNVSFIAALPLAAPLGVLFLKERMTRQKLFFTLLAFWGVAIISIKDWNHLGHWGAGELLAFVSAIFISLSYVLRRYQKSVLNNAEITSLFFLISFVALFLISTVIGESLTRVQWDTPLTLWVLLAGVMNVWGIYLMNYGFEKVDAITAANILTIETVFALICGLLFYREVPTVIELLGGVLICVAAIKVNAKKLT